MLHDSQEHWTINPPVTIEFNVSFDSWLTIKSEDSLHKIALGYLLQGNSRRMRTHRYTECSHAHPLRHWWENERCSLGFCHLNSIKHVHRFLANVIVSMAPRIAGVKGLCWKQLGKQDKGMSLFFWLVVSTHLKNISQIGNHPQVGVKIKNIWNHHLAKECLYSLFFKLAKVTLKDIASLGSTTPFCLRGFSGFLFVRVKKNQHPWNFQPSWRHKYAPFK